MGQASLSAGQWHLPHIGAHHLGHQPSSSSWLNLTGYFLHPVFPYYTLITAGSASEDTEAAPEDLGPEKGSCLILGKF